MLHTLSGEYLLVLESELAKQSGHERNLLACYLLMYVSNNTKFQNTKM